MLSKLITLLIVITLLLLGVTELADFSGTISYIRTEVRSQLRSNEWRWKGRRNTEDEEDLGADVEFLFSTIFLHSTYS